VELSSLYEVSVYNRREGYAVLYDLLVEGGMQLISTGMAQSTNDFVYTTGHVDEVYYGGENSYQRGCS
jgi:hypothetical protein